MYLVTHPKTNELMVHIVKPDAVLYYSPDSSLSGSFKKVLFFRQIDPKRCSDVVESLRFGVRPTLVTLQPQDFTDLSK